MTFYALVGGHLTFEGVTSPSQKGHTELPGNYSMCIFFHAVVFFACFYVMLGPSSSLR